MLTHHLNSDLEDHLKSLGVISISGYKLWCYRHGLSTELHKTLEERRSEIALFRSKIERPASEVNERHNPRRAEWIAGIFHGELQEEKLSDVLHNFSIVGSFLPGTRVGDSYPV